MRTTSQLVAVLVLGLTGPGLAAVQPPGATSGTLSLIDDDRVEILYHGREDTLVPATFVQTLEAVAIAANTPPSPLNPALVENAIHVLGIPHKDYRSCWPDDGGILLVPTAPSGASDAALGAASAYYDPLRHAREFDAAYWQRLFTYTSNSGGGIPGWPGDPTLESLKETIVGSLPFPVNLGPLDAYARQGIVPLLQIRGEYAPVCFLICLWFPKCTVVFIPVAEGYGIREIR